MNKEEAKEIKKLKSILKKNRLAQAYLSGCMSGSSEGSMERSVCSWDQQNKILNEVSKMTNKNKKKTKIKVRPSSKESFMLPNIDCFKTKKGEDDIT